MKHLSRRCMSFLLCLLLLAGIVPTTVFAAVDYNHDSASSTDHYYKVVSQRDWSIAPGIDETEIILNNDGGTRRQVVHAMIADTTNEYVKVTTSYANMDTSVFETATVRQQAYAAMDKYGWNVVGAMNTCLSWYDNYPADHVREPLGFMMIDGETVWDLTQKYGGLGFPTCVVIYKDDRPDGMPKVEMKSITGTQDLNGYEEQVIPCSSGLIVDNGVNKYSVNHVYDNSNSAPRSVVGITADGKVVIMENDGRQTISIGMSMYECAEVMLDLGCVYACNCDGGGSSTFLSKRPGEELAVINSPSDGTERETTSGILFVSTAPADGEFAIAHISSENKYYTPESTVQFSAIGTDYSGQVTDIPEEAQWALADDSFGTIDQNGLFTSTGKTGEVTAQITMPDSRVTDRSVVFSNNKNLSDVKIYYWSDENTNMVEWPGTPMSSFDVNEYNQPRLKFELPEGATKYIITGYNGDNFYQTSNMEFVSYTQAGVYLDDNYTAQYYDASSIRTIAGEATVEIVIPEIAFTAANFAVKYGTTAELTVVATTNGGLNEVVLKPGDYTITCDNAAIGSIDGTVFTAVEEADAPENKEGTLTVTLNYGENVNGTARIIICPEITETLYDFEDGIQNWTAEEVGREGTYASYGKNYKLTQATAENGEVHDGNSSMKLHLNQLTAKVINGSKDYFQLIMSPAESIILHDVQSYGVWVYVNDEMYAQEFEFKYYTDSDGDGVFDNRSASVKPIKSLGVYQDYEESGWYYLNVPVGGKTIMIPGADYKNRDDVAASIRNQTYLQNRAIHILCYPHTSNNILKSGTVNGIYDVYFDNFTVDYAADVADRTAPAFGTVTLLSKSGSSDKEMVYGRKTTDASFQPLSVVNTDDNELNVTARVSDDGDGINGSSAKVYVDGKQVNCTYANGMISMSGVKVADGIHRIKFEIADRAGNKQVAIRLVNVAASTGASTIIVEPKDATLDKVLCGSLYWMNLKATDIETIQSVSATIDLNSSNHWELEHVEVADGFTYTYEVNESTNTADITFTRTAVTDQEGEAVLASLPIRIIYFADDIQYQGFDEATYWTNTTTHFWAQDLKVDVDYGEIEYVNGYETDTIGTFSNGSFSVSTEMYKPQNDIATTDYFQAHGSLHVHNTIPVADKPATCTEDGYSGRTYCEECDSIVDWGTVVAATGHQYEFVDGVLKCTECDELYNGVYDEDGKYYVDGVVAEGWQTIDGKQYYFIDGGKNTADLILDNHLYTFDENGVYDENYSHTGPYYEEAAGKWRYFDHSDAYRGWVIYDSHPYFYGMDYYAGVGTQVIGGRNYMFEGEQGKVIGAWVQEEGGKKFYYGLKYYKNVWVEIQGATYYFDNDGHCYVGTVAIALQGEYLGAYEFDADGKFVGNITGVFRDPRTGYYHYAEDGVLYNGGLLNWENNYYFARSNYLLATAPWYVPADKTNELGFSAGTYQFAEDGKMVVLDGIQNVGGSLKYYINGIPQAGLGITKINGDYYYVRANGNLVVNNSWYVDKNNAYNLPGGTYQFGEDGKMVVLNGIQNVGGSLKYYINGIPQAGLGITEIDGDYYYIRANGNLVVNNSWYVDKNNQYGFPGGTYQFGEDGKMVLLNGIVEVGGSLKYYINGIPQAGLGITKIGSDYYYVRANGNLVVNNSWYVDKNNQYGFPGGTYQFGEDGKMVLLNGIVEVGGSLKYYVDGIPQAALGLIEVDGDYYYVRATGNLVVNDSWYVDKNNNYGFPGGTYLFDENGKMISLNGVYYLGGSWKYYVDNEQQFGLGLIQIDNNFYYVRGNGTLATTDWYVGENKLGVSVGVHHFGEDGVMDDGEVFLK